MLYRWKRWDPIHSVQHDPLFSMLAVCQPLSRGPFQFLLMSWFYPCMLFYRSHFCSFFSCAAAILHDVTFYRCTNAFDALHECVQYVSISLLETVFWYSCTELGKSTGHPHRKGVCTLPHAAVQYGILCIFLWTFLCKCLTAFQCKRDLYAYLHVVNLYRVPTVLHRNLPCVISIY